MHRSVVSVAIPSSKEISSQVPKFKPVLVLLTQSIKQQLFSWIQKIQTFKDYPDVHTELHLHPLIVVLIC